MGEHESDVRMKVFNGSRNILQGAKVPHVYERVADSGHVSAPPEMFVKALRYVLKEE